MMMRVSFVSLCVVALLVAYLGGETPTAEAVTCISAELAPCLPAFTSSSPPSDICCTKLKEQEPCLCGYIQDPALKRFVANPKAKEVVSTCGVAYPQC